MSAGGHARAEPRLLLFLAELRLPGREAGGPLLGRGGAGLRSRQTAHACYRAVSPGTVWGGPGR